MWFATTKFIPFCHNWSVHCPQTEVRVARLLYGPRTDVPRSEPVNQWNSWPLVEILINIIREVYNWIDLRPLRCVLRAHCCIKSPAGTIFISRLENCSEILRMRIIARCTATVHFEWVITDVRPPPIRLGRIERTSSRAARCGKGRDLNHWMLAGWRECTYASKCLAGWNP